jgi:hypothetical protein
MKMVITPVYSDIFDGEKPTLEFLINDIPSEVIISILCVIFAFVGVLAQIIQPVSAAVWSPTNGKTFKISIILFTLSMQ